ncbi:MAG TPA: hypothetical protein VHB54_02415 [Mucilaginibacter sp.]|nr:hypothetical protein [Mucilaginibacter sp.]
MGGVIEIYKISFFEKLINGRLLKSMSSTSEVLDQFLTDYNDFKLVDDFVISYIDEVLSNRTQEQTLISQCMISVRMTPELSQFFQDPDYVSGSRPDFVIPTSHLRQIAVLWRDFLKNNRQS